VHGCTKFLGFSLLKPIRASELASLLYPSKLLEFWIATTSLCPISLPKKRILFIHPDLGIGGAERLVIDAAVSLQDQGHNVTIYTSHCDPRHCFDEARNGIAWALLVKSCLCSLSCRDSYNLYRRKLHNTAQYPGTIQYPLCQLSTSFTWPCRSFSPVSYPPTTASS
jgi:hypothetical protein